MARKSLMLRPDMGLPHVVTDVSPRFTLGSPRCSGMWEFPKIKGTLCWGALQQGSYYLGYFFRVPYFRKPPCSGDIAKEPRRTVRRSLLRDETLKQIRPIPAKNPSTATTESLNCLNTNFGVRNDNSKQDPLIVIVLIRRMEATLFNLVLEPSPKP